MNEEKKPKRRPPNFTGKWGEIRCRGFSRGSFINLILRVCPFCEAALPQGETEL